MNTPKEYALAVLACTRNNFLSDLKATARISAIYAELGAHKDTFAITIYALLREALHCKKLPDEEIETILNKFSVLFLNEIHPLNLFCFPYAGGTASMYKDWISYLPDNITLKSIEYPGRGSKYQIPCIGNFNELLNHLEHELLSKLKGDFVFFGHSLGAIVCFELACRIKQKYGLSAKCLFLSACPPPSKIMTIASISQLNDQDFIKKVVSLNGMPKELLDNASFLNSFLPIFRNDFGLLDEYVAQTNMICDIPIIIYGGIDDPHVHSEDMKEWQRLTTHVSSLHMFPGDHFFIRKPEELLKNLLTQVRLYA